MENLDEYMAQEAKSLEKKRAKLNFWNGLYRYVLTPAANIIGISGAVLLLIGWIFPPVLIWGIINLVVGLALMSINNPAKLYFLHVKEKVIPALFEKATPNLTYKPFEYDKDALKESDIFTASIFKKTTRSGGEDLVYGEIDGVEVKFNEVWFYKTTISYLKTFGMFLFTLMIIPLAIIYAIYNLFDGDGDGDSDSDGDGNSDGGGGGSNYTGIRFERRIPFFGVIREESLFYKGLFMSADFHKEFDGKVVVMPKKIERLRDRFSDNLLGAGMYEIKVELSDIDDNFRVYSSDKQMGYYVLSPKVLEAINEIITIEKAVPILVLNKGKMYMTIPWEKDYFSVDLKKKVKGPEYFSKYLNEINSFQKIVHHFNLDKRLWTKV